MCSSWPWRPPTGIAIRPPCSSCSYRERGTSGAAIAVADVHLDAVVTRRDECRPRGLGKRRQTLDRVHLGRQLGEHRSLVPGPRTDVEHSLAPTQRQHLADAGDHVRLGDRLAAGNRQGGVGVRAAALLLGDEELTRDTLHGRQHALVPDVAAPKLVVRHPPAGGRELLRRHRRRPRTGRRRPGRFR